MKSYFITATVIAATMGFSVEVYAASYDYNVTFGTDMSLSPSEYDSGSHSIYAENGWVGIYSNTAASSEIGHEYVRSTTGAFRGSTIVPGQDFSTVSAERKLYYNVNLNPISGFTAAYVPLLIDWELYVSTEGADNSHILGNYGSGVGTAWVYMGSGNHRLDFHTTTGVGLESKSMSGTDSVLWDPDQTFGVNLYAYSSVSVKGLNSDYMRASAYADPVIYIDPRWEHHDMYTLTYDYPVLALDEGRQLGVPFNSVSAVPVPAALVMFAPALLGFLGFRRKAKNSIA